MKTEIRKISQLKPHPKNPKLHTPEQIEQIANSIREFGFTQPVVIDERNMILIGHGRTKAAELAGLKEVPVFIKRGLTKAQKIGLCTVDNVLAQETELDEEALNAILKQLSEANYDIEQFGFTYTPEDVTSEVAGADIVPDGAGSIGQIVILMDAKDFDEAQRKFDAIREREPNLKDNTEVFMRLLELYEHSSR